MRSRAEALGDLGICGLMLFGFLPALIGSFTTSSIQHDINTYQMIYGLSYQDALFLVRLEVITILIFIAGFLIRALSNVYEFSDSDRLNAHQGIVLSSGILLVGLSMQLLWQVYEFLNGTWSIISMYHVYLLLLTYFLAFQLSTSSIKSKYIRWKEGNNSESSISSEENVDYKRIAN